MAEPQTHLDRFYAILAGLESRIGKQLLKDCHGRMGWTERGVYFFFEDGECRRDGVAPRVVRVGTHAVSAGSKTSLWNRLSTHRGGVRGQGNHRGSVFRLQLGGALLDRDDVLAPKVSSWGTGSSAKKEVRDAEAHIERAVSTYIGSMPFLWVEADDEPGAASIRRQIEANAIALLSRISKSGDVADPPSPGWLGQYARSVQIRASGLWNIKHTEGAYDPRFLDLLTECADRTCPLCPPKS